jgi:hypothetical protein
MWRQFGVVLPTSVMIDLMMAPQEIDGAPVIAIASVAAGSATGATRHHVNGELVNERIRWLAICENRDRHEAYLFYCAEDWTIITDSWYEAVQDAFDHAQRQFEGVSFSRRDADC